MNISVIGTGYVGLVTGTCLAEEGNSVHCIDIDEHKIKQLSDGKVPIYEPDLDKLFARNTKENRLKFTTSLKDGVEGAAVIFLALPTPPNEDGSADLSYILDVAEKLGPLLKDYTVIVNKSTVPVGTAEAVYKRIAANTRAQYDVVSNPEFLREGFAIEDFMKPDRVVIGSSSKRASAIMQKLFMPFVRQGNPIYFMDERSAELTKYAANSFLATKISFMNEIANLAEAAGASIDDIRLGIGADARIGNRFLFPGIGYGGSCFPKDVKALRQTGRQHDYELRILAAVEDVNTTQKQRLPDKVKNYYKNELEDKTFALWGLAFKPDTDDIREAPSLDIIKSLTDSGAHIIAYDPEALENVKKVTTSNKKLRFSDNQYDALKGADALLIATEWGEFRAPDFAKVKRLLNKPVIFDGRNLYDPLEMKDLGFYYESIGRKVVTING